MLILKILYKNKMKRNKKLKAKWKTQIWHLWSLLKHVLFVIYNVIFWINYFIVIVIVIDDNHSYIQGPWSAAIYAEGRVWDL